MGKVIELKVSGEAVRIHTISDSEMCIADDGGWIPGVYSSIKEALKGREDYLNANNKGE